MISRPRPAASPRNLLSIFVFAFLFPLSASADYFNVKLTRVDSVRRVSQNDRVELQVMATTVNGTVTSSNWSGSESIPEDISQLRVSYLFWKTSEEHSDSILDACQQMALLAQANPGEYELDLRIQVPDTSQVVVFGATQVIAYMHTAGYNFNCLLTRVD